jgi:hypothetical protein
MVVDGAWLFVSPLAGMEDCGAVEASADRGGDNELEMNTYLDGVG